MTFFHHRLEGATGMIYYYGNYFSVDKSNDFLLCVLAISYEQLFINNSFYFLKIGRALVLIDNINCTNEFHRNAIDQKSFDIAMKKLDNKMYVTFTDDERIRNTRRYTLTLG